jgi:hypothetical protein
MLAKLFGLQTVSVVAMAAASLSCMIMSLMVWRPLKRAETNVPLILQPDYLIGPARY